MDFSQHFLSAERSSGLYVETTNAHGGGDWISENMENWIKIKGTFSGHIGSTIYQPSWIIIGDP